MGLAGRKIKQRIGADPRNLSWADDASRFGSAYLAKFGWDSSQGLGVAGDGRTSHIKVAHKLDMLGIGAANVRDPDGIAWKQNRDFENLLRRLNEAAGNEGENGKQSGEETKVEGFISAGRGGKPEEAVDDVEEKSRKKKRRKEKAKGEGEGTKKKQDCEREAMEEEGSGPEDGKKRKQKDKEYMSKKRKGNDVCSERIAQEVTFAPSTIPRHRAHRARAIAAKKMISNSTTAISEILGIAPASSSVPITSINPDDDTTMTKSTKSVVDYFREKLQSKPSGSSGSSTPNSGSGKSELDSDAYCAPRGGLGSGLGNSRSESVTGGGGGGGGGGGSLKGFYL